jgi:hypothetical protein
LQEAGVKDIIGHRLANKRREDLHGIRVVKLDVVGSREKDVERCISAVISLASMDMCTSVMLKEMI